MSTFLEKHETLLGRHLPEGWTLEDELALLTVQPEPKQRVVADRLRVIDAYLNSQSGEAGDATAAASDLGVGRRQFFHLVAKVRELGPTRGLIPGFRNVQRKSVAREGLGEPLDAHLRKLLDTGPTARMAAIEDGLRRICDEEGIPYPSTSAVRRRIHALRQKPRPRSNFGKLAADVTVDQINLDLPLTKDGHRHALITLILDNQTKIILGHGVTHGVAADFDTCEGISLALADFRSRIPLLAASDLPIASNLKDLTWILSKEYDFASNAVDTSMLSYTVPRIILADRGPRRHGSGIMRIIGDRLPPFFFKPTATERDQASPDRRSVSLREARRLVNAAVVRWNEAAIGDSRSGTDSSGRFDRLTSIERELSEILLSFLQQFDDVKSLEETSRLFSDAKPPR